MPPLKYSIQNEFSPICRNNAVTNSINTLNRSTNLSYTNAQFPFKLLKNLNHLREQARFCDIEIIAGDSTFNAHRVVLSSASAYFEAMFRPELGLCENKQKSVVLHTIDGDILKIILNFVYTGRCEITQVRFRRFIS